MEGLLDKQTTMKSIVQDAIPVWDGGGSILILVEGSLACLRRIVSRGRRGVVQAWQPQHLLTWRDSICQHLIRPIDDILRAVSGVG